MILLLIRHGESEADLLDVHEGRADFELTERGHMQAQAMAAFVNLLAGMPREEAAKKYPKVENLPADRSVYGQESRVEFRSRAERVLEKIRAGADEKDEIAVITHGGMINQLYHALLKLPIDSHVFFQTGDTGIHVIKVQDDVVGVLGANMTGHAKGR